MNLETKFLRFQGFLCEVDLGKKSITFVTFQTGFVIDKFCKLNPVIVLLTLLIDLFQVMTSSLWIKKCFFHKKIHSNIETV